MSKFVTLGRKRFSMGSFMSACPLVSLVKSLLTIRQQILPKFSENRHIQSKKQKIGLRLCLCSHSDITDVVHQNYIRNVIPVSTLLTLNTFSYYSSFFINYSNFFGPPEPSLKAIRMNPLIPSRMISFLYLYLFWI